MTDVGACRAGTRRRALTAGCRDPETRLLYVLQGWDKEEGTDRRLQGSRESICRPPCCACRAGMLRRPSTAACRPCSSSMVATWRRSRSCGRRGQPTPTGRTSPSRLVSLWLPHESFEHLDPLQSGWAGPDSPPPSVRASCRLRRPTPSRDLQVSQIHLKTVQAHWVLLGPSKPDVLALGRADLTEPGPHSCHIPERCCLPAATAGCRAHTPLVHHLAACPPCSAISQERQSLLCTRSGHEM